MGAGALVYALALAGCDSTNNNDSPPNQVVRYGAISAKVRGLDPMDIGDTTSSGVASNFYECLFQYHYLKRPYVLEPALAADMPTYSEDRLTVTIPIRKDVYFHDDPCFPGGQGRQLVAEDFIYAWKRIAYLKNVSKNWWIFEKRIVGLDEFRETTKGIAKSDMDYRQKIAGLEAIDRFTVQIKLKKNVPDIEFRLTHLPLAPVPREAVEHYGDEFMNHPVGTGPFMLDSWMRGSKIVMVRNPKFREEKYPNEGEDGDEQAGLLVDAGKALPLIDRAEYRVILEDQPYWLTFMNGETDAAGIPKDAFDSAINSDRELTPSMLTKGINLIKHPEPTTFWVGFNMQDPVAGTNLPLRQAMSLAFDRKKFIDLSTNGRGLPARGPLPPTVEAYAPDLSSPYTTFNLALATKKLAEARALHRKNHGGDLPVLKLIIGGTDATAVQMGQFYQRCFEAIGLQVKIDNLDWPSMQDKVKTKSAQMYSMGWIMDWPDPENMLLLWYGPNESPGPNNFNYRNEKFDELYDKITVMPASPQRTAMFRQMEQIVVDDLPCIFTTHRVSYYLKYNWYKNYKPHVYGYGLMKYLNIDKNERWRKVGH